MASYELPPALKKNSLLLAPTTISALDDDILREIFLRLPCLPSLVSAALTCHSFLDAVRSSPAFRRRFRALHPPPLLGIFLEIYGCTIPAFTPVRRRSDPDLAAVIGAADFFLTRLPDDAIDVVPQRSITDSNDGYLVLVNDKRKQVAVYNPLTRALDLFPPPPIEGFQDMFVEFHVLSSEEDPGMFRVVCVGHSDWGARAAVLSSDAREWEIFPLVEADDDEYGDQNGTLVNGFVYWTPPGRANSRVLNTATLQFSRIDLPPYMKGQEAFRAGQTKDGQLCMVYTLVLKLVVWIRRADDDGVAKWMLDNIFPLEVIARAARFTLHDDEALEVVAIIDGFVYLSTYVETQELSHNWFLSFCLETFELKKICSAPAISHLNGSYPYIMAWPSCLVRNKLSPQLKDV